MIKEIILKYALQNAVRFNGKATPNAVLGKVIKEHADYKVKIGEIKAELNKIVDEVNSLSVDKQRKKLEEIAPELLVEKVHEKKHELPPLKNVKEGKVVMRFEPSPSGPLHIGHAYVLGLNSEYCRIYGGKLILRIGDTNPNNIYVLAYELIVEDAKWVTKNNISEVLVQSERIELYYGYMERLFDIEKAYVCMCDNEEFKEKIIRSEPCPCRELPKKEQLKRWKGMLADFEAGSAVVRLKTELEHRNPAIRDFPLFRIIETAHPRQGVKYRVWPLMNMAVSVDDINTEVTHVIRAKDHYDNAIRQRYIFEYLQKPFPETIFVGRINFLGMDVSCSKTRPLIENGTYSGWDDIRLPFLLALKRRGFVPEAFIKYAVDVGVSLNDKTVSRDDFFKSIEAFNRDVIDSKSRRYFFVWEPVKIKIENAPELEVELDLHPDNMKGGRKFHTDEEFFVVESDFEQAEEKKICRLMDCLNFFKDRNKVVFDSVEYGVFKEKGSRIIHWLPANEKNVDVEIVMPDNSVVNGIAEKDVENIKVGEVVQFARFGFCRLDSVKNNKFIFWFAHK